MKGAALLSAAGLVGSALAGGLHHRHGHLELHRRLPPSCVVKTIVITGPPTLIPIPAATTTSKKTVKQTSYTTVTVAVTPAPSEPAPTPSETVFPTPGTYTIPAQTVVLNKTVTVCAPKTTPVPGVSQSYGGVTSVVQSSTAVVCPSSATPVVCVPGTYVRPAATVTVTETKFVYVCPSPTLVVPSPTPKPEGPKPAPPKPEEPKPEPPKPETPKPEPPKPETPKPEPPKPQEPKPEPPMPETPKPEPPKPETPKPEPPKPQEPKPEPPKPQEPKPDGPKPGLGGGEKWGMTYSPFTDNSLCKDVNQMKSDIATIKQKGFKVVRVYAPDCNALQTIGDACKANGLRMIIGVFISNTGIQGAQKQVTDIVSWGQFNIVDLIVVGNEAIFQKHADAGSLASFIASCKATFQKAGYTGPVTTTEPLNIWQSSASQLCGVIDVLGANIHPFFNAGVAPSEAGKFVKGQMDILQGLCNKKVINLETGWPNGGGNNGLAVSGGAEQKAAIKSIVKAVGSDSVFFSFRDDKWKQPGPFGVEQNWGCINVF
ncbi:hypothetical protein LOZ36_006469 [Ophidiomyces ophidiicola]|nr:hypothetical protein LOZ36_006469 [Ophidiomyces ophidiicola]